MATLGRPRDPGLDAAAVGAAIALIREAGYPRLTMAAIAERAGVSKTALYRRWPNRRAVVVEAVKEYAQTSIVLPDAGSARADIVELLTTWLRDRQRDTEIFDAMTAAMAADPELAEQCREAMHETLSEVFRAIVRRGVERGDLPPDTDVELLSDVVPAMARFHRVMTGQPFDADLIARIATQFF